MGLRQPQAEALERLMNLIAALGPDPLKKPPAEVSAGIRRLFAMTGSPLAGKLDPTVAALTFDLATGVGKTRLAAAVMAALHQAHACTSFWIVTPRRGITDKFIRELNPKHPRYLFGAIEGMEAPAVLSAAEFAAGGLLIRHREGMRIAVSTAQWLTSGEQVNRRCDSTGQTPVEEMASRGPVVAIIDESHHFDAKVWSGIPRQLGAALVVRLTATPTDDEAVLFSYPLGKCLQEGEFTKRPVLQIQNLKSGISALDADRLVLRDALACLDRVTPAIRSHAGSLGITPAPAIALVAARNTTHADEVEAMLVSDFGLAKDEVLTFHSKKLSDDNIDRLLAVESPNSRVRVVVQVFALEEGWDVSNVFVIAPLREMATYRGIRQLMGRGLRLPFGKRTGIDEIDELNILAYGRSTVAEVVREATLDLGRDSIAIRAGALEPAASEQLETCVANLSATYRDLRIAWIDADIVPCCGEVDLSPLRDSPFSTPAGRLDLQTLDLQSRSGLDDLGDDDWCFAVAGIVVQQDCRLNMPQHGHTLVHQLRGLLRGDSALRSAGKRLAVQDAAVLIFERCGQSWQSVHSRYEVLNHRKITFRDREFVLRSSQPRPVPPAVGEIHARQGTRCPVTGFRNSVMSVGLFDTGAEVRMAQRLDAMAGVKWWLRNDPRQVSVPTSDVQSTSPDFVAELVDGQRTTLLLLEVKGRDLWDPRNSQARRQARDLKEWSRVAAAALSRPVEIAFIAHDDVDRVNSIKDIRGLALDADR